MRAIERNRSEVVASAEALEAIRSTTEARQECLLRARANALAAQVALSEAEALAAATVVYDASPLITLAEWEGSTKSGGAWPPKPVVAPRLIRKCVLDVMPPDEKKVLAASWCTSKLYGNNEAKRKGPASTRNSHAGSAKDVLREAEKIFGRDALMDKANLNRLVLKCVGFAPPKPGAPKLVPDGVTTAVLGYFRMLTAHRIPVFKSTVLGTFRRLVDGTPMGEQFKVDCGVGGGGLGGVGVGGGALLP